jgi:uncharacterized protein DUF3176
MKDVEPSLTMHHNAGGSRSPQQVRNDQPEAGDARALSPLLPPPDANEGEAIDGPHADSESATSTARRTSTRGSVETHQSGPSAASDSSSGHGQPRQSRRTMWWLEFAALGLSWSAFASLIIVLAVYNGRPVNEWRFVISPNAVVSIMGAIVRSSLAFAMSSCIGQGKWNWFRKHEGRLSAFGKFEDATRGPWGAVRLLWWSQFRSAKTKAHLPGAQNPP